MAAKRPKSKANPPAKSSPTSKKATAKSSSKSTVSGPTQKGGASAVSDAASAKMAGVEAVAAAMPYNAAKPGEFGKAALQPPQGQTIEAPHPAVGGSTLTETNASEKVGRGNPQMSFNPTVGPLDRVRVDSRGRAMKSSFPPRGINAAAGLVSTARDLAAYDRAIFGAPRDAFLRAWIEREPGHALAFADDGRVRGYAVLRRCREGAKIGPLFADDPAVAADLLVALRAAAGDGTPVFLDVPHANPTALEIAAASLDSPVFETARMYRNGRPPEDISRVFGVTTFELG